MSVKSIQTVVAGLDSAQTMVVVSFRMTLNPPYFAQYMNAGATAVLYITVVGSGRCLKTGSYSNCENPVGLRFRLEITSCVSGGGLHCTPQSSRGIDNPTAKRPSFSNTLKEKHGILERKGPPGPLSPVLCCPRHASCDTFHKSNSFNIKLQLFYPFTFTRILSHFFPWE